MNQLAQLAIVGTVTPCTKNVWIANQLIGAQLIFTVSGAPIPGPIAKATLQSVPLPPVKVAQQVTVVQRAAGFADSLPIDIPIQASPTPKDLSAGQFHPFYACTHSVLIEGAFADATVDVRDANNVSIGNGTIRGDGRAEIPLTRAIALKDKLHAVLTACGKVQSANPILAPAPMTLPKQLSKPVIAPAFACDTFIAVSNFTAGANIAVSVNNVQVVSRSVPLTFFTLSVPSLKTKDVVKVDASIPGMCDPGSAPSSAQIVVGGASPAPDIGAPLCKGQLYVEVVQLRVGAEVQLQVTGQNTLFFGASTPTVFCTTPPLPFPANVVASQQTCANVWTPSKPAAVGSLVPQQCSLVNPPDGTPNEMLQPTLMWDENFTECDEPSSFNVQLATDKAFLANLVVFPGIVTSTNTLHIANNLAYQTTYFWRVQGTGKAGPGPRSKVSSFTTIPKPTDPNAPNDDNVVRTRWFVQDCCPMFRNVVPSQGTHQSAYDSLVKGTGSTCTICPIEVDQNTKVDPC